MGIVLGCGYGAMVLVQLGTVSSLARRVEQQLEWRKRRQLCFNSAPIEAESPGTASDTGNQVYETCYDEATGRWYYVNVTTGHSMWAENGLT